MSTRTPVACTVAGADSGGGAGLHADIKTFAFHQVHGASAVTALTVQDTCTVHEVLPIDPRFIVAQLAAVHADLHIDAMKCGLLPGAESIRAVAQWLAANPAIPLVLDPVMVSRHGIRFADDASLAELRGAILSRATIVTPNRREAEELTGLAIADAADMEAAARAILRLGARSVLVKGGGLGGSLRAHDVFAQGDFLEHVHMPAIDTGHTHGTGCTLAASITARIARGEAVYDAVWGAKKYVHSALESAIALGRGQGTPCHFWPLLDYAGAP